MFEAVVFESLEHCCLSKIMKLYLIFIYYPVSEASEENLYILKAVLGHNTFY